MILCASELVAAVLACIVWMAVARRSRRWLWVMPVLLLIVNEAGWYAAYAWMYPDRISMQALGAWSVVLCLQLYITLGLLGGWLWLEFGKWKIS